jgi:hypothetical protein
MRDLKELKRVNEERAETDRRLQKAQEKARARGRKEARKAKGRARDAE